MSGPLLGVRVLELAGIGPAPFCAMMLADMGAEIVRIDRLVAGPLGGGGTVVDRGRRTIALDVKKPQGVAIALRLIEHCDALIEGFRPGVMERLGLGPEPCLLRNPRLVYGRMTGWGQSGPLAQAAGHDINYLALSGALHAIGPAHLPPPPPLHLVGDMGGGAMMLAFGMACALFEARSSGLGQTVDAAICDGASALSTLFHSMRSQGRWRDDRQANLLDGGAPFYRCYTCADGKDIAIGAIEPQFYQLLLQLCDLSDPVFTDQWNQQAWPALHARFEAVFATRTREAWCERLEGTDACFAPVLSFEEAPRHPHHKARGGFIETAGVTHPAPAPRLSRTPAAAGDVPRPGEHTAQLLEELGFSPLETTELRNAGVIA